MFLGVKPPDYVSNILEELLNHNYEAYLVGGCVRDSLLGYTPYDWDITTDALPDEIEELFAETIPTGKKYGTITVIWNGKDGTCSESVEVTTFRKDSDYSDGRRPDDVIFGDTLKEDIMRRDFTINALAWNPIKGLVDATGYGINDLLTGTIRAIGIPIDRFKEDALRLVRCIRFALKYNFQIEYNTLQDCHRLLENNYLDKVSRERIHDEILKMLACDIDNMETIYNNQLTYDCLSNILGIKLSLSQIEALKTVHKKTTKTAIIYRNNVDKLRELKFSNEYVGYVLELNQMETECYKYFYLENKSSIQTLKKLIVNHGFELTIDYCVVFYGHKINYFVLANIIKALTEQIITRKELVVKGNELKEIGYKNNQISYMLNVLVDKVNDNELKNVKKDLLDFALTQLETV